MSSRRIGNYQITDYIGSGGFGSVFKAEDVTTPGRIVAIKELHKKHTRNAVIKQRFFQEALAMARLDHPNLPRLYTFGEDNGCYYLVMEFISGQVLSEELHECGPVEPARAIAILTQVLEALSYAHRNGIIHRDLKPDNIILIANGSLKIKVLDFGIARIVGGENLTLTGEGFGTPAYMSPERLSGSASDDPRADIYSTGVILFEMLAGKTPFQSQASDPVIYWTEMKSLHQSMPLPPLDSVDVPQELERVMLRATAKRIEDRYASAEEMLAELKGISCGNLDQATIIAEDTRSLKTMTLPLEQASTARAVSSAGSRVAAVAVVVLLLALVVAAYFVLRGPARGNAQAESAQAPPAGQQAAVAPSGAQEPIKQGEIKSLADAKKAPLEKKLAEAEKKLDEEKKSAAPEQTASTPAPQSVPPLQPAPAAQDACVGVRIASGQPARFKVVAMELPESSGRVISGMSNNRGMWFDCGLKAGNRARVMIFGMKGVLRGTREITLAPGKNLIDIQASAQPGVEPAPAPASTPPFGPARRRPRFQRP